MSHRNIFFKWIDPKGSGNFLCKRQRYLPVYMEAKHKVTYLVYCVFTLVFKFHLSHFWPWSMFSALESHGYLAGELVLELSLVFC